MLMSTVPRPLRTPEAPAVRARPLTLVTDDWTLVVPPEAMTMEGFREWATRDDFPERVRVTYLQGEIILDMSNEEVNAHVAVKTEIYGVLGPMVKRERLGRFYSDGVLLTNVAAEVSNNPDSLFLSRDTLDSARAKLVPKKGAEHLYRELEGIPDWVLEVISDSSVTKDRRRLREAYHHAGIPEYWLIDARDDKTLSFQVLLRRKNGYAAAAADAEGWQRSKVFGRSFRLERALDEFGLWEYTLHVRAD
jgi:Uma2 family endonuclease